MVDMVEKLLYDLSVAYGIEGRGDIDGILAWMNE
jgi:hypothetical protein